MRTTPIMKPLSRRGNFRPAGLCLAAFACLLSCAQAAATVPPPHVQDGRLDLRDRDWRQGALSLDGEWLFDGQPVAVPGRLKFRDGRPAAEGGDFGQGSYRLELRVALDAPPLAVRLPMVGMACRVSVNGQELVRLGQTGDRPGNEIPENRPVVVPLPASADGRQEIEIQISNHHDINTGLVFGCRLGPHDAILAERELALASEALVFGGLLLLGLFQIGAFLFRTSNRSPLWLGLLCIALAARMTLYSETLVLQFVPGLSWFVIIRLIYASMPIASFAFLEYLHSLHPDLSWRALRIGGWVACGAYALLSLAAPEQWFMACLPLFQLCLLVIAAYSLIFMVRALVRKRNGAVISLVGIGLFGLSVVIDIVQVNFAVRIPSLVNMGLVVFMLSQALVVSRIFNNAFRLVEVYSADMERLNSSLERFIPREVLGLLHKKDITEIALGDYIELRMTVFFMDIRDFTTLSEAMTPQDNFRFINSFLNRFGPLIRAHGGFVDKYLGDGIMALFPGAPGDAVRTACAMRAELASYNADRGRAGYPPVEFGIGIHTGALMLGTIGENRRMDSTVISDTVNSASRLEGLTKNFGRPVLISGATLAALTAEEQEWFVHIGDELVKGKTRRLEVWALDRPCV